MSCVRVVKRVWFVRSNVSGSCLDDGRQLLDRAWRVTSVNKCLPRCTPSSSWSRRKHNRRLLPPTLLLPAAPPPLPPLLLLQSTHPYNPPRHLPIPPPHLLTPPKKRKDHNRTKRIHHRTKVRPRNRHTPEHRTRTADSVWGNRVAPFGGRDLRDEVEVVVCCGPTWVRDDG